MASKKKKPAPKKKVMPGKGFTWTDKLEKDLLACLASGATVRDTIDSHRISRTTVYKRIRSDEEWKERWNEAIDMGNDAVRDEIRRRGMQGVLEPVYHEGRVVGRKRRYSDNLLMFYAKSRMPEFKDNVHEHNHGFNAEGMAERLADKLAGIVAAARSAGDADKSE